MVTTLMISGSGFSPTNVATITITATPATPTQYSSNTDSNGNVSFSIGLATINGINKATVLSIYATDYATGASSNTIQIPINVSQPAPTLNQNMSINTNFSASAGRQIIVSGVNTGDQILVELTATQNGLGVPVGAVYWSVTLTAQTPIPHNYSGVGGTGVVVSYGSTDPEITSQIVVYNQTANTYNIGPQI